MVSTILTQANCNTARVFISTTDWVLFLRLYQHTVTNPAEASCAAVNLRTGAAPATVTAVAWLLLLLACCTLLIWTWKWHDAVHCYWCTLDNNLIVCFFRFPCLNCGLWEETSTSPGTVLTLACLLLCLLLDLEPPPPPLLPPPLLLDFFFLAGGGFPRGPGELDDPPPPAPSILRRFRQLREEKVRSENITSLPNSQPTRMTGSCTKLNL